jgi:hypothetical protein
MPDDPIRQVYGNTRLRQQKEALYTFAYFCIPTAYHCLLTAYLCIPSVPNFLKKILSHQQFCAFCNVIIANGARKVSELAPATQTTGKCCTNFATGSIFLCCPASFGIEKSRIFPG